MSPAVLNNLSNPLVTPSQISTSASQLDGIPAELETSIRYAGAQLTQAAGILLRLPQDIIAQAIVIFMRFWVGGEGGSLIAHSPKARSTQDLHKFGLANPMFLTGCIGRIIVPDGEAVRMSTVASEYTQRLRLLALQCLAIAQV